MDRLIGCCGFKCYTCAAYEKNIKDESDREKVAIKWKEYFSYDTEPEKIRCKGCFESDCCKEYMLHPDCEYRNCVKDKNISKCSDCKEYPCKNLKEYVEAYKEAYENIADRVQPEDKEGYFLTYTTALDIK